MLFLKRLQYRKLFKLKKTDIEPFKLNKIPTYYKSLGRTLSQLNDIIEKFHNDTLTFNDMYGDRIGRVEFIFFIVDEEGYLIDDVGDKLQELFDMIVILNKIKNKLLKKGDANAIVLSRATAHIIDTTLEMFETLHTMS